jgi:hypothetical protein
MLRRRAATAFLAAATERCGVAIAAEKQLARAICRPMPLSLAMQWLGDFGVVFTRRVAASSAAPSAFAIRVGLAGRAMPVGGHGRSARAVVWVW